MKKLYLVIGMLLLLPVFASAIGEIYVESTGQTTGTTQSRTGMNGMQFTTDNAGTVLRNASFVSGNTGTHAYVLNVSQVIICKFTVGTSDANCELPTAGTYWLMTGSDGSSWNRVYEAFSSYPITNNISAYQSYSDADTPSCWTVGCGVPVNSNSTGFRQVVSSMTLENGTVTSTPYINIKVTDLYDDADLEGLTVTLADGTSNTTQSNGIAYFYNRSTQGFNVTDTNGLYFDYTGGTATENTTTNQKIFGAFVTLTAYDLVNNSISVFNTTSELSFNSTTTGSLQLVLKPNSTNIVTANASQYLNRSFTVTTTPQDTGSYNLTGFYQSVINISAFDIQDNSISNFTANFTGTYYNGSFETTNGSLLILGLFQDYSMTVDSANYSSQTQNFTVSSTPDAYNFTLLTENSINITFYDEQTGALIDYATVTLDYLSDYQNGNTSTTNGLVSLELLTPATYTLIYDADGYDERFYLFTVVDDTYNFLNLTLLNSSESTTVTINVKDTLNNFVEGAIVKIYKFDSSTNDYTLQEVRETNFEGQTIASMLLNSPLYYFVIEYQGETVLTTTPTQVYGTTLTLIVDLVQSTGFEQIFTGFSMTGSVSFNNVTNTASFTYNDQSNTLSQSCLNIYRIGDTRTLYNKSCSTASSGTLTATLDNVTGRTYVITGIITGSNGVEYTIDATTVSFTDTIPEDGSGLLMMFFMVILFVTALGISIEIATITAFSVPLMFTAMGLSQLTYAVTVPLMALGFVLAFIMGVIRK